MKEAALIPCCYALGCCTAGYCWTLWHTGKDIRCLAGGNAGARNVGRVLGASGFAVTFLFDFTKGAVATGAAGILHFGQATVIACMVAAVVGTGEAQFQPMYLPLAALLRTSRAVIRSSDSNHQNVLVAGTRLRPAEIVAVVGAEVE